MANKRAREMREKENRRKIYEQKSAKLNIFHLIAIAVCGVLLLTYFFDWTYVYNTDIKGAEVNASGWSFFLAAISNNYSSASSVFGNISVPFYYYAQSYVEVLGVLTIISVFLILIAAAIEIVAARTGRHMLSYVSVPIDILLLIMLVAGFVVALSMKDAEILSKYCSGNPACSIRSLIIIPVIVAAVLLVTDVVAAVKYFSAGKYLR
ncbi:MAG: hypothetical protein ACI4MH_05375 [Candidatus Coproplasma sp.]